MTTSERWKDRARRLKVDTYALYLAYRDPEVPWYARVWVAFVVGYALSPIDLIPDFIPVLGYLDDLVIVPIGIAFALRMVPVPVMERCREKAKTDLSHNSSKHLTAAIVIVGVWLILLAVVIAISVRYFRR